ncbi:hypothetical protein IQ37_06935 [Chryseobacterium piperi]|uniref:Uncharacterized protein n=1 Tax=Chryseobacterium piperi TaxID=558152 RepID=A0A086BK21_9FLAO|nr:hypothetical protein [Chryseobacterium piperi]ASW73842.1 hypothetical protein CJF12_05720 [Chryseobacterium piperi]KFF29285.1 hypothetical protein IQ37_06935 [Chryseobacterium piperi]
MEKKLWVTLLLLIGVVSQAQVGIGTANPHPSAMLDVNVDDLPEGSKKGLLCPKVALRSRTDQVTIPEPAKGLLVYCLGTHPDFKIEGYMYWNGEEWVKFNGSPAINPSIGTLNCSGAYLEPPKFIPGEEYSGTLIIPYNGGNGGDYATNNDTIASTGNTGLKAILNSGTLNNGSGAITYSVSGVPSSTSKAGFPISFLGKNCQVQVNGNGGGSIGNKVNVTTFVGSFYDQEQEGVSFGNGKYKIRLFKRPVSAAKMYTDDYTDVQLMYLGDSEIKLETFASTMFGSSHWNYASRSGRNGNGPFVAFIDRSGNPVDLTRDTNSLKPNAWYGWGEPGIRTANPEKRQYVFTPVDQNDKTFYRIEIFFADPTPYDNDPIDSYLDTKVIFYIEEIPG